MTFFELRAPNDMLAKAHREHARLRKSLDIDHVFNFFVTTYHIQDYLRETGTFPKTTLDAFLQDQDMQDAATYATKGSRLAWGADATTAIWNGTLNSAPFNSCACE